MKKLCCSFRDASYCSGESQKQDRGSLVILATLWMQHTPLNFFRQDPHRNFSERRGVGHDVLEDVLPGDRERKSQPKNSACPYIDRVVQRLFLTVPREEEIVLNQDREVNRRTVKKIDPKHDGKVNHHAL